MHAFHQGEAGLSVLTSMGYGTPYITRKTQLLVVKYLIFKMVLMGILYNESSELVEILKDIEQIPQNFEIRRKRKILS